MATIASVAARRGNAEAVIKTAVSALAEKFGVEVIDQTYPVRDIELRRVMDMESIGANLTSIVEAMPKKAEKADAKKK